RDFRHRRCSRGAPEGFMIHADRKLLLGILAVQMNFVSRDALIAGMNAWLLEKHRGLGEILVEHGALTQARHGLLEQLVDEHLAVHQGDAEQSLAALDGCGALRDELRQRGGTGLEGALGRAPSAGETTQPGAEATLTYAAGQPTANGTRFSVLRPHAQGGLGQVSVALDHERSREVALKEIRPEHADNAESRARFLVEAEVTGRLEHPGVVPVYGLGCTAEGRPFYAMRLVKGQSLKDAIQAFHRPGTDTGRDR